MSSGFKWKPINYFKPDTKQVELYWAIDIAYQLYEAKYRYYIKADPIMSDSLFDLLEEGLKLYEKKHKLVASPNSTIDWDSAAMRTFCDYYDLDYIE